MRTNFVLIDFESVQPESLAPLADNHFKILVFVGASQAKLSFEVAASLQQLGSKAEYIKISGNGPNALDFHIAYYIGKYSTTDPTAYFHIISKDTGFDPLIQHLKSKGVFAGRVKSITDIPLVKTVTCKSPAERLNVVINWLKQPKAPKPRTVKTLSNSIGSLFMRHLSTDEIEAIVESLTKKGHISINGTKVTYATQE